MNKKQKRTRNRIVAALVIFAVVYAVCEFVPLANLSLIHISEPTRP